MSLNEDISIGIEATGADTTADAVNKVTQSIKGLNDAPTGNISAFATSIDNVKNAATGVNDPLTQAATGVRSLGGAYDETATKSKSLESSFTDLGSASGTASTNFKTFATSMVSAVGSIAAVAAGVIGIAEGYTQMERAQTSADRASNRYQQGLILLQKDQQKVNDLVAAGKQGTPEYAQALETLRLQQDKNRANLDFMNEAQSRANESIANFATQIVPEIIGVVSGAATAITTVPRAIDQMKSAFSGLSGSFSGLKSGISDFISGITGISPAAGGATTALTSFKGALAGIVIPVAIAAAIVAAFFEIGKAISENGKAINDFSKGVQADLAPLGPAAQTFAKQTITAFQESGNFINDAQKKFTDFAGITKNSFKETTDVTSQMLQQWKDAGTTGSFVIDQWIAKQVALANSHGKSIDDMIANFAKFEAKNKTTDAAVKEAADNLKHYQEAAKMTGDSLEKDLTAKLNGLTAALTGVVPGLTEFGNMGTTIRTSFTELGAEVEAFGQITDKTAKDYKTFGTDVAASLEKLKPAFKDLGTDANQILNQALRDAKAAMGGDSEAATQLAADIKLVVQVLHDHADAATQAKAAEILHRDTLIEVAAKYIGYSEAVKLTNKQLEDINKNTDDGTQKTQDLINSIIVQNGVQQNTNKLLNEQAQGYGEVYKKELDLKDATATLTGGLQAQFELLNTGQPQLEAFNKGQRDQYQSFIDQVLAIDNAAGKQKEYFREIQDGIGILKLQDDEMVALNDEYIKAGEQLIKQNTALSNSQDLWTRYNTDVLKGKSAVADFEIKLQDTKVQEDTQLTGLKAIADGIGGLPAVMAPTIQNYQDFIKANYDGGAAVIDFNLKVKKAWTDLTSAGDTFFSALIKSFGETGKTASDDFAKAFKDLPSQVQKLLTPQDQQSLAVQAAFAQAGDAAGQAFAIKTQAALGQGLSPEVALKVGETAAASIIQGFVQQHPQFAAQAQQFFSVLSTGSADQIKAALDQMAKMPGPLGEIARNAQTALKPMFSEMGPGATSAVQTSIEQLDKLGLTVNTTTGNVTTATGQIVGKIDLVTGSFTSANTSAATFAATIKGFGDISSTAQIVFQGVVTQANLMVTGLNTSLHQMSGFAAQHFGEISSTAQITFQGITSQANTVATTLNTAFRTGAQDASGSLNGLKTQADSDFRAITSSINAIPGAMNAAFRQGAQDAAGSLNQLASQAQTSFNSMVRAAQTAAAAIAAAFRAATAAPTAQGAYTPYQGAFAPQQGQAAQFTPFQGVFAQHGFVGVVDKPTSFVVGEAGPEYVSVIPGGSAGTIGTSLTVGLADMVAYLSRTNESMGFFLSAANKNTSSLANSSLAADKNTKSLNDVTTSANNNLIATNANTAATDNSTTALNATTVAADNATESLGFIEAPATNATSSLTGTSTAANGTTGSLNGLSDAVGGATNAMLQIPAAFQSLARYGNFSQGTPLGGAAGGGGGAGGGAPYYGPAAFAGLAQYGNFSYGTPTSGQPGAPGVYPGGGGGGGGQYGPFGGLAQYGNFSGQSPAPAQGAAYYGGPPTGGGGGGGAIQGAPFGVGPFGGLAQYGNFSAGSGTGQMPSGGGQPAIQGAPFGVGPFGGLAQYGQFSAGQAPGGGGGAGGAGGGQPSGGQPPQQSGSQGGVVGPQGGSSGAPQQQGSTPPIGPFSGQGPYGFNAPGYKPPTGPGSGGGSYYGGPPTGYQSSPYGAFGGLSQYGKFAAAGFEGIVSEATRFIAGEAGAEHVKITPISNIASSSNDVNSILAMIAELIRQVANQSLNINLSSYLDGYQVYKNQQKYTQGRTGNYLG